MCFVPDGGWSHRILEFDKANTEKVLCMLMENNPNPFAALKKMLNEDDRTGVFREMCDSRGIRYRHTFRF